MLEKFRYEDVLAFRKCNGVWLARLAVDFDKYVAQWQHCTTPPLTKWKPRC